MTVGAVKTILPQIHMIPVFPCIARRPTSKLNLENNDTKHDSLFSFFFFLIQIFTFRTLQKTNWRTQPLDIIWFHEFFWQMKINFSNKKKNNWLTSKFLKSFLPKSHAFCFFFLSYMNNQQSVPKFNSSVWPGPTEKTVSLFCSTSIRLWDKDQLVRANVQP